MNSVPKTVKITGGSLTSAYGRTYKSRKALVEALNAGKDFTINTYNYSGYCSIRDIGDTSLEVRYGTGNYKVCMIKFKDGVAS